MPPPCTLRPDAVRERARSGVHEVTGFPPCPLPAGYGMTVTMVRAPIRGLLLDAAGEIVDFFLRFASANPVERLELADQ